MSKLLHVLADAQPPRPPIGEVSCSVRTASRARRRRLDDVDLPKKPHRSAWGSQRAELGYRPLPAWLSQILTMIGAPRHRSERGRRLPVPIRSPLPCCARDPTHRPVHRADATPTERRRNADGAEPSRHSPTGEAAIDQEVHSGTEACSVTEQEDGRADEFVDRRHPPDRCVRLELLDLLRDLRTESSSAWQCNRGLIAFTRRPREPHSMAQALGQVDHRRLGGIVVCLQKASIYDRTGHRGDVDNSARPMTEHPSGLGLTREEDAGQINVDDALPLRQLHVFGRGSIGDTGTINRQSYGPSTLSVRATASARVSASVTSPASARALRPMFSTSATAASSSGPGRSRQPTSAPNRRGRRLCGGLFRSLRRHQRHAIIQSKAGTHSGSSPVTQCPSAIGHQAAAR